VGDAAVEEDVRRLVAESLKAFGKIDVLVNNAGDGGVTKPSRSIRWRTGATPSIPVSPARISAPASWFRR